VGVRSLQEHAALIARPAVGDASPAARSAGVDGPPAARVRGNGEAGGEGRSGLAGGSRGVVPPGRY
jgi:hypothetical protein